MKYGKALLSEGNPSCCHVMMVNWEWGREIGRCYCGRIVDYTVLQQRIAQLKEVQFLADNITMAYIMGERELPKLLPRSAEYIMDCFKPYCNV